MLSEPLVVVAKLARVFDGRSEELVTSQPFMIRPPHP